MFLNKMIMQIYVFHVHVISGFGRQRDSARVVGIELERESEGDL